MASMANIEKEEIIREYTKQLIEDGKYTCVKDWRKGFKEFCPFIKVSTAMVHRYVFCVNTEIHELLRNSNDIAQQPCPTCGRRIGSHDTWESLRCKLITSDEAREIFSKMQ